MRNRTRRGPSVRGRALDRLVNRADDQVVGRAEISLEMARDRSSSLPTTGRRCSRARSIALFSSAPARSGYEILIVDNNSSRRHARCRRDGTRADARTIRCFFEPRRGRLSRPQHRHRRGSGAHHRRSSTTTCEADPAWVATIKHTLDAHPDMDCVGGRIDATLERAAAGVAHAEALGTARAAGATRQIRRTLTPSTHRPCLATANFASRRAALEQVGGFSPDCLREQDRELQLRLWAAGNAASTAIAISVTTEVPRERMTKAYHRRFNVRAGASHTRMRYRDRLDRDGRLAPQEAPATTLFGSPGLHVSQPVPPRRGVAAERRHLRLEPRLFAPDARPVFRQLHLEPVS